MQRRMPSPLTRRRLLVIGTTVGSTALAGCTGSCTQGLPFLGTGMPHDGEIAVERVDTVPEQAILIDFSELPESEQSLLRTAITEGVARACMDDRGQKADALQSFANRLNGQSPYLVHESDHYALWVRVEDMVSSGTASPPESGEDLCC